MRPRGKPPVSLAQGARLVILLAFLAVLAPAAPGGAQDVGYVAEIPDLPLMPGLRELSDAGVVFDKPSGRIVEAYAQGEVTRQAVLAFYGQSLPQLGWRPSGDGYTREGETLLIEVVEGAEPLTLRFVLRPQ